MASEVIHKCRARRIRGPRAHPTDDLSDREMEVLERLGKGEEVKTIAKALNLGPKPLRHISHIKEKLKLANARQVSFAVQWSQRKRESQAKDLNHL